MPKLKRTTYRVKDKGGPMGGREITYEAPEFVLSEFLRTPNAEHFIKKAYEAEVRKIAREVEEGKNGSVKADLSTYEMIVARSLKFTKSEVTHWLETRDWARIAKYNDPEGLRKSMEEWLPSLATRVNYRDSRPSNAVAEKVVAALADTPDPVADFLFVMLTVPRPHEIDLVELL